VKPAVYAIRSALAVLTLVGLSGFDRPPPGGYYASTVVRVNDIASSPTFQILDRLAEVFQYLIVDEFNLTCLIHDSDKRWNSIDDLTKMESARG
jgi:hypothetical protein